MTKKTTRTTEITVEREEVHVIRRINQQNVVKRGYSEREGATKAPEESKKEALGFNPGNNQTPANGV